MNTEAIIETLLQTQDEQILNTPLDDLNLSTRVYRSLWRWKVRTVGDVVEIWSRNRNVSNIGERARCEILDALQAWCLSLPNLINPAPADIQREAAGWELDRRLPIEALHLSPRTYRALKRNQIDTLDDIDRDRDKIASLRGVGTKTLDEIKTSLAAVHRRDPNRGSPPAKNYSADRWTADEPIHEILAKKYVITDSGVVVSVDLLQAEEPRRPREERWRNVARGQASAKAQDYAPKNTFQAIAQAPDKISSPIQRPKKTLDGSVPISTKWLEMSLYLLEKARTSRQVRTINCPICMAITLSIRFKKHLVNEHPQAFRELKKVISRR